MADLQGAACPDKKTYLGPLGISEQLCVLGLSKYADKSRENSRDQSTRYALACLDLALSANEQEFYSRFVEKQMNEAFAVVDEVLRAKDTFDELPVTEAATIKCFEPLFRARCSREPITPGNILEISRDLGELILALDPQKTQKKSDIKGKRTELEVMYLLLRTGDPNYIPWIASPREEKSSIVRLNHDLYLLQDMDKVPIQVKFNRHPNTRRYAKSVVVIYYQELLARVRSRVGAQTASDGDFLPKLIRNELSERGSRKKQNILTLASRELIVMIETQQKRDKALA
ncbi:MAG: hypothetical protein ACREGJ_00980 [Candidatus Saccharimonadales bacterium]